MKKKLLLPIIILFLTTISQVNAQENISPTSLELTVYPDGSTIVTYIIESNPSEVRINIELIGENIENLIIKDEENFPLYYEENNTNIIVDSIGASEITFIYYTYDFTHKNGPIWDLNVSTPIETGIYLPEDAALFDLSDIPLDLKIVNNQQYVLLPSGNIHVSYLIPIPDLKEEATTSIEITDNYLTSLESQDIVLLEARSILEEAVTLFQSNQYIEAKNMAQTAQETADETRLLAEAASEEIALAQASIDQAERQGKTIELDSANQAISTALEYYEDGLYTIAEEYAQQANQYAIISTESESNWNTFVTLGGSLLLLCVIAGGYYIYTKRNEPHNPTKPSSIDETVDIDVAKIFDNHETLRIEDREVIKYLAENRGEAFASEIRERFDLPRSTAWRLIRRLKDLEIVDEIKIGNQSLIRIKEEFHV